MQVGANDLYAGIPAESTYREVPALDHGVPTYMDVASASVSQSGHVDVAPAQYGVEHDNGNNDFEVATIRIGSHRVACHHPRLFMRPCSAGAFNSI